MDEILLRLVEGAPLTVVFIVVAFMMFRRFSSMETEREKNRATDDQARNALQGQMVGLLETFSGNTVALRSTIEANTQALRLMDDDYRDRFDKLQATTVRLVPLLQAVETVRIGQVGIERIGNELSNKMDTFIGILQEPQNGEVRQLVADQAQSIMGIYGMIEDLHNDMKSGIEKLTNRISALTHTPITDT